MFIKKIAVSILCLAVVFGASGCEKKRVEIEPADGWYATWAASSEVAEAEQIPQNPALDGNTLRQQIKVSVGGDKIRLSFSNEYGDKSLVMSSVHIARLNSAGSPKTDPSTDKALTFGGSESVTIPAGKTALTDELDFSFEPLDILAITIKLESAPTRLTCHREAGCTSWIVPGDHVSDETFETMELMSSLYFLNRADTYAPAGTETVVCFGDSIADSYGSTYNRFNGWAESLSKIMQNGDSSKRFSVIECATENASLFGSNSIEKLFERDVLNIPGVHKVVILIGANDIPSAQYDISKEMAEEYKKLIEACHERGISIYAGTLTPFEGNTAYYSELHEGVRLGVNEFIAGEGSGFDGYVDFSNLLCYAESPSKLQAVYDSGDCIHPSAAGYEAMAKATAEMLAD